jgi:hypothetical protein
MNMPGMFESRCRGSLLSGTLNLRYAVCETSTFLIWEDFATDRVGCRAGGDVPIAVEVAVSALGRRFALSVTTSFVSVSSLSRWIDLCQGILPNPRYHQRFNDHCPDHFFLRK